MLPLSPALPLLTSPLYPSPAASPHLPPVLLSPPLTHILRLPPDIPWPEECESFSPPAGSAVDELLCFDPGERPALARLRVMPLFSGLDWERLLERPGPFVPAPDDATDTTYFDREY